MVKEQKLLIRLGLMVLLAGLLISACGAETEAVMPEVTPTQPESGLSEDSPAEVASVEETSEMDENGAEEPQSGSDVAEEVAESTPTPDLRIPEPVLGFEYGAPNLKATAPSSFVRAAGKPQLVELFAFW
ncbi:MAG TPA: hypothetical protein VLA32_04700 [Anaerolineales bacterium]|jgi:hypothetical protein|nr:hypothetical protein [Anaerolineales bacterium]